LSGLTVGGTYYISATTGVLTATNPGSNARAVGQADSATTLIMPPTPVVYASPVVLVRSTTPVTIGNTTTETNTFGTTVGANILGTQRTLHFSATATVSQNSGANNTLTLRFKYGGTTLQVASLIMPSANATGPLLIDCELTARGATNLQDTRCVAYMQANGSFNQSGFGTADYTAAAIDTTLPTINIGSTVDSTQAQTLLASVQWSVANALSTVTLYDAYLEVK